MIWTRKERFSLLLGLTFLQLELLRLSWSSTGVGVQVGRLKYSASASKCRSWLLSATVNRCTVVGLSGK